MSKYANYVSTIRSLVQFDRVHRDVYCDPELFSLEMQRLWRNAWLYVGHESQVPDPGDYYTVDLAGQPVVMVRSPDGELHVLLNRCAHKGTKLVSADSGNCRGFFRCPYHGWTYRSDGTLRAVPLSGAYEAGAFSESQASRGMSRVTHAAHRGFVFARLSDRGLSFEDYFGDSLSSIDNMANRSPVGRLEVVGGVLRYMHNCNWKMFVEVPVPMVIEQFTPFVSNYEFFDRMGVQVYAHGHSYTGVHFSIHSKYSSIPEYEKSMEGAYGAERAHAILAESRHNTVYYPSLTIKGAIQTIRVVRPLIESYTLRLVGAPDVLLERSVMYNRLINAPTSVVGHDDLHCYRAMQEGLVASGNEWVNLQRNYSTQELTAIAGRYNGTSEVPMRGQFKAWLAAMTGTEAAS